MAGELAAQLLGAALRHVIGRLQSAGPALATPAAFAARLSRPVPVDVAALELQLAGVRDETAAGSAALGAGAIAMPAVLAAAPRVAAAIEHLVAAGAIVGAAAPAAAGVALPAAPSLSGLPAQLGLGGATPAIARPSAGGLSYRVEAAGSVDLGVPGLQAQRVVMTGAITPGGKLGIGVEISGLRLEVAGESALLQAVLGAGTVVRGDVRLRVDTERGLTTEGVGGPVHAPVRRESGPIEVRGLTVAVADPGTADAPGSPATVELRTQLAGGLGDALRLVVDGAGLQLQLDPGAVAAGGAVLRFGEALVPTALGASLTAGPVAGGGLLEHSPVPGQPRSHRFGGAFRLRLGPVDVKAYGLFTDGPGGLSFVVVMSVEFVPPLELGLAFTLNGVGGIVGLGVTADTAALQAAARSGALHQLMFPADPVAAGPQILQTLGAVFPAHEGGFVVGPMLALGWGRPVSFVRLNLALVLSLPDPTVIILGHLRVAIPPAVPLIDLNAEVYGEFSDRRVLIIVSLVDSRVGFFQVSGDIGILVRFGGDPEFAISAGGFHPSFVAPVELASLRRITADLSPPIGLSLRAEGYVALTPATVQFGGNVEAAYVVGPAAVRGYLGVDALVHLDPFGFVADIRAGVSVEAFDVSIASVDLAVHLEGPAPWRVSGSGKVRLPWPLPDPSISFGPIEWGPARPAPAALVRPVDLVAVALGRAEAWNALRDPGRSVPVVLRAGAVADPGVVLIEPAALLQATQSAVPLDTAIARVGASRVVPGQERVRLEHPVLGGPGAAGPTPACSVVEERFALGQYLDLTDDQALAAAAFEQRAAGVRVDPRGGAPIAATDAVEALLKYETFFPGREESAVKPMRVSLLTRYEADLVLAASGVGRCELRAEGRYGEPSQRVELHRPEHVEVRRVLDLEIVAGPVAWSDAYADYGAGAVRAGGTGTAIAGAAGGVQVVGLGAAR